METIVTILFFVCWSSLIILTLNPELFIRLRYRMSLKETVDPESEQEQEPGNKSRKLDRYV